MGKFESLSIVKNEGTGKKYYVLHDSGEYTLLQRIDDNGFIDGTFVVAYYMHTVRENSNTIEWGQGHYFVSGTPLENLQAAVDFYTSKV